jgi:hypothetical protein
VFFAIAQCFGALGPIIYGHLIGAGSDPNKLFIGYLIGATVMVLGGVVEVFLGVPADQKSLEDVASPLSLVRRATEALHDRIDESLEEHAHRHRLRPEPGG